MTEVHGRYGGANRQRYEVVMRELQRYEVNIMELCHITSDLFCIELEGDLLCTIQSLYKINEFKTL